MNDKPSPSGLPRVAGRLDFRQGRNAPAAPPYPIRPIDQSASKCARCKTKQIRTIDISGPMPLALCKEYEYKEARITSSPVWKYLLLAWFVSPPPPADDDQWYLVSLRGNCKKCGERHPEKTFRRRFGKFGRLVNWTKSVLTSSIERLPTPASFD